MQETLKKLNWSVTSYRHMIAELGYPVKLIPYKQQARKKESQHIMYGDIWILQLVLWYRHLGYR